MRAIVLAIVLFGIAGYFQIKEEREAERMEAEQMGLGYHSAYSP